VKYAFVEKNRRQYGVPALYEALQVSRSGYYAVRGTAVPVTARSAGLTSPLVSGRSTKPAASRTALPGCTSS
jgi:hypothetical protein